MEQQKPMISDNNKLLLAIVIISSVWLFYLLVPILMPFFIAGLLAYLGDPIVDKLETKKCSRTLAVTIVFALILIVCLLLIFILFPMLSAQVIALFKRLPDYLALLQSTIMPRLAALGLPSELVDIDTIKQAINSYWSEVGHIAGGLVKYASYSGAIVLQYLANLILIPVLTFYLLRDWDELVARFRELLPQRYSAKIIALSLECDAVLAAFIRGQLMVMCALAIIYTIGLAIIGIELALLLGVIAGLVSFVPYLGLIVGIALAGLAAFLQFHEWLPVLMVVGVFSVAQMLEGMVLTPRFVGGQIGLHPVAVLFAVMAGAQLFGFTGVLLALPVAAVIMVLIRHAHQRYLASQLYK